MPKPQRAPSPHIAQAIQGVRAYMVQNGHIQKDVVERSGVSQDQVSKFLTGKRCRISDPIRRVCQYANIDLDGEQSEPDEVVRMSRTIRRVIGNNASRAAVLTRLVEALAPTLLGLADGEPRS